MPDGVNIYEEKQWVKSFLAVHTAPAGITSESVVTDLPTTRLSALWRHAPTDNLIWTWAANELDRRDPYKRF